MNTKIALSILSIVATTGLIGGATYAYFFSTATSTGNVFGAGTLTLLLDDNNDTTPAATITASFGNTLAPGDSTSGFISMHNSGSINIAKVKLGATETVTSDPDLAGKLNITTATIGDNQACDVNPHAVSGLTTLAALNGTTISVNNSDIAAGSTKYLCMTFTLDSGTGNTYQNKSITETFSFEGDQDLSQ
jgi:predicted ribosomally synthesized peptide with SipW-like signal peptide